MKLSRYVEHNTISRSGETHYLINSILSLKYLYLFILSGSSVMEMLHESAASSIISLPLYLCINVFETKSSKRMLSIIITNIRIVILFPHKFINFGSNGFVVVASSS